MDMPLWFSNLIFWSLQVALLALAAGLLARLLHLHQPRVLLAYWRSLLALSFLLPLLQPWHRPQNIAAAVVSTDFSVPLSPSSGPAATHWHLPSLQTIAAILGIGILVGIALRFAILALGLLKLRRLRHASSPMACSAESAAVLRAVLALVAAPAEFRLSSQVDSPVTFGFLAPVVLLPDRFPSLELRFQTAIACHELLHVRRHDWAHHLLEEAGRALFWFHPAIAWLISRVRIAREQVVDLEVVRLTNARKSYLEALLEFTNARTSLASIPAPPFLAERQLIERVSLMLKEVRMSQRRSIASLMVISSCLVLVGVLAAWAFPLKGAPRLASPALSDVATQSLDATAPKLLKIAYMPHNFDDADLSNNVVDALETRMKQLPDSLTVETAYNQAKADTMRKALEDFWAERGVAVEVRASVTPYPRSPRYVVLHFDMYKQTALSGRLEGGVSGGVHGGIAKGISGEIAGGVSKGIVEGVSGGISGGINTQASSDEPRVDLSTIWTDKVKRGPMLRQVHGLGTLSRAEGSENSVVKIALPAVLAADVRPNQNATIDTRLGLVKGHVTSINPGSSDQTRTINLALDAPLPQGFWVARATANVAEIDATMDIERLDNVLQVGRPVNGRQNSEISLFKIVNDGSEAVRTQVKLGRGSVSTIEVVDGLQEGDKVILSDMSSVANAERVRLTDEKHLVKR